MSIQDLDKTDLKKVLKHYNTSIKKEILKLSGSKKVLLDRVLKEYKHNVTSDKQQIIFTHKKKKSIPTYTLNLKGTTKRKEEDTEDKRVLDVKRKKVLERKKKKEQKDAEKVNKIRQEERIKILKKIKVINELKKKTKNKTKIKVIDKKLSALERQKKLLSASKAGKKIVKLDIKPIKTIQKKIDTTKDLDLSNIKMPKALLADGASLKKTLIEDGIIGSKTSINQLIGADIDEDVSIYFTCYGFVFMYLMLYILKKNKNDCIIFSPDIKVEGSRVKIKGKEYRAGNAFELFNISYGRKLEYPTGMTKMEFFKSLTNCLDNNKSVVIPLGLRGHQNAITINKNTMEIARYEPHGGESRFKISSKRIDNMVRNMFKNYTYKGKKFEVLGAEESCPAVGGEFLKKEFRGLQSFSNKRQGGVVKQGDPAGFCCVWSLFIMDLSLRYPKEKMEDIRKRAQQLLGAWKRPRSEKVPEVRRWIRGYTKYIQDSAKDIFKNGIQVVFPRYLDADDIEKVIKWFDNNSKVINGKFKGEEMTKLLRMMKGKNRGLAQMIEMTMFVSYFIHIVKEMMKFKGQTRKGN